jgi:hypothetical protein
MNAPDRMEHFANEILKRAASELKDVDELVGACVMILAGSFRDGITETEMDGALARFTRAVKLALGHQGGEAN